MISWRWLAATLLAILLLVAGAAFSGIEYRLRSIEASNLMILQRLARIETLLDQKGFVPRVPPRDRDTFNAR